MLNKKVAKDFGQEVVMCSVTEDSGIVVNHRMIKSKFTVLVEENRPYYFETRRWAAYLS